MMTTELQASKKSLYETDFVRWVETTLERRPAARFCSSAYSPFSLQFLQVVSLTLEKALRNLIL